MHAYMYPCMFWSVVLASVTENTVCFHSQRSWVFTHWLPVVRHMMEQEVKRVTTVSIKRNLSQLTQLFGREKSADLHLRLCLRCGKRGEDEPSVR